MNGIRVCILSLLASTCFAGMLTIVRGRVESDGPIFGAEYIAGLMSQNRNGPEREAAVANDGTFEFRDVVPGMYELRVTSNQGAVLAQEMVDLTSYMGQLSIRLPKQKGERPGSGTVSVSELQHPIPPKAFHAFMDAEREANSGHDLEAVRKLQRALQIYPGYVDARCNLGVQYIHQSRYPEALEQFQKAVASGPPSAMLYGNLAYSLVALERVPEAEKAARRAIELDDSYTRGHYLLGNILSKTVTPRALANAPEAARELRRSAGEIPHAYIVIAQVYLAEGDKLGAAEELRLYLRSGDKSFHTEVEKWMNNLAKK